MGDFRSFKTAQRQPAQPMKPVVDPAVWSPDDLRDVALPLPVAVAEEVRP